MLSRLSPLGIRHLSFLPVCPQDTLSTCNLHPNPELPCSWRRTGTKIATAASCGSHISCGSLLVSFPCWKLQSPTMGLLKSQLAIWQAQTGAAPVGLPSPKQGIESSSAGHCRSHPSLHRPNPLPFQSTYWSPVLLEHWQPFHSVCTLAVCA